MTAPNSQTPAHSPGVICKIAANFDNPYQGKECVLLKCMGEMALTFGTPEDTFIYMLTGVDLRLHAKGIAWTVYVFGTGNRCAHCPDRHEIVYLQEHLIPRLAPPSDEEINELHKEVPESRELVTPEEA